MRFISLLFASCLCVAWLSACGSAVVPPILLESGRLEYPAPQRDEKVSGWVLLSYNVNRDGVVSDIAVVDAQPAEVFNQAAMDFVRTWRFQPQKRQGVPEAVTNMQSRITFTLDDTATSYDTFIR